MGTGTPYTLHRVRSGPRGQAGGTVGVFLHLPRICVGVTAGRLLTGLPFGFMALPGYCDGNGGPPVALNDSMS